MGRKNRTLDGQGEKDSRVSRRLRRKAVSKSRLTYCSYERDKENLKTLNYQNPSPKLTKVRFKTRKDAKRLLQQLKEKGREESRVYHCRVCNGYHLTKTEPRYWLNED